MTDQQQPAAQERSIDQVQAALLASIHESDRARRPEIIARGLVPIGRRLAPTEDSNPFEFVRVLVDEWSDTAKDPDRRAALVEFLANHIDTGDLRALRLISDVAAAVTIRRIRTDAEAGTRPVDIARFHDVTESYVYRVLREQREQ